jgi:hypothetical protein
LAVNLLSFRVVDNPFFKNTLHTPCKSRNTISGPVLAGVSGKFTKALQDAVKDQLVHLGFDLWSSVAGNHYIVSALQWIDHEWELVRAGLDVLPLNGQCAVDIVASIRKSLADVGVKERNVVSVCTDGASNETAAATFDGFCSKAEHLWCLVHKLNLVIGDGFEGRVRARDIERDATSESRTTQRRGGDKEFWKALNSGASIQYRRDKSSARDTISALCEELRADYGVFEGVLEEFDKAQGVITDATTVASAKDAWRIARRIITRYALPLG